MAYPQNPFGSAPQVPDWLQQSQPLNAMPSTQPTLNLPTKFSKGGMFGSGYSFGQALSDGLNGYLAGMGNPVGQANIQALHQRRMMEQQQALAAQQYARERQDKRDDFTFEQDYRAQHPTAAQPTEYERMLEAAGLQPGTPEYVQHVQNYVKMRENPMVMTPYGPMPYSSVNPPAPSAPIGKLTPIDGDAGGNASGGFPY
jgi:hypothetical protein